MTQPARTQPTAQYGCQAVGCQHAVRRGHLMCMDHWRMVPKALQDAVWATWRQQRQRPTVEALRAYLQAKQAAIDAVQAKQEARRTRAEASTPPLF